MIGFSDEEGTRFGKALLGSQAVAGVWEEDWWDLRDRDGVTLHQAFLDFGLDPRRVGDAARRPEELVGYLEAHIEQGPYLEAADRSLGYVTTIAGARRFRLTFVGEARHAGGTPYHRRRDALVGASEAITLIERRARESECIATVGRIEVQPGAINVIPGRADISLDLRAATDAERDEMWALLSAEIEEACAAARAAVRGPRDPQRARDAVRALAPGGRDGGHPQHRRRRPDRAVEPGRPRRDGGRAGHRRRHALRPLPRRHQPPPGGGRPRARRRRRAGRPGGGGPRGGGPTDRGAADERADRRADHPAVRRALAAGAPRGRDPARAPRRPRDLPLGRARRPRRGLQGDDEPALPQPRASPTSTRSATTCAPSAPPASRAGWTAPSTAVDHLAHEQESLRHALESPALDDVVALLAGARRVLVVGWRNSHPVALHLRQQLAHARGDVRLAPLPGQVISEELADLGPGDAVVVVGFRRRPADFGAFLEEAGRTGATVVLLGDPTARRHAPPRRTGWSARSAAPSPSTAMPPR